MISEQEYVLYHGSDVRIQVPRCDVGESRRDFGQCFYTTHSNRMARDWALKRSVESGSGTPVVNKYVVDLERLGTCELKVKRFEANEEWARFVYDNRYVRDYVRPDFDIIIGPLADRGLAEKFAEMEMKGLTFADIAPRIEYTRYRTLQVCFCSERALCVLKNAN